MAKKLYYVRRWEPPSPTVSNANDFKLLFNKRKLASLRAAIESREWQQQFNSDSGSDADDPSHSSTSCTASPEGATTTSYCQEVCSKSPKHYHIHNQLSTAEQQHAEAELQAELQAELAKRKAAEEQQLQEIYSKLLAEQAEEEERKLAEKAQLVAQHAEATQQISEVQQRLEELQQNKHDLVKQLKQAMQAGEAAKQQAALQQQQLQLQMQQQQQQEQWAAQQRQQRQLAYRGLTPLGIPPGPGHVPASHTPSAAGGPGIPGSTTPGDTPGSHTASAGLTPGHTPAPGYTLGAGLFSPGSAAARSQWLFSTPAQPPPPPPRQPADHMGGSSTAAIAAVSGQHGQQQQQLPRASWGQPPAPPRACGSAGTDTHAAGPDIHMQDTSRSCNDHIQQQQGGVHSSGWQQHPQDYAGTARGGASRSPRQSVSGSRPWHGTSLAAAESQQHVEPPDSPEEGEALPSPRVPGQRHHRLPAAAVGSRAADAALHMPSHSLHSRAEGSAEQTGVERIGPAASIRRTSSSGDRPADRDRESDRDRPAMLEYGRPAGLLRSSSGGGASGPGYSGEGHSHHSHMLRTSSGGGSAGTSHAGGAPPPPPLLAAGSGSAAGSGGSYRGHSGIGRSQSAGLADREHAGFRTAADRAAAFNSMDGAEGPATATPVHSSGNSRQPRSGGQYGAAHGQYYAAGGHSQYYAGTTGRRADDIGAAGVPLWRTERRRSSSTNIDRFGEDARPGPGGAGGTSVGGDGWQGDGPAAAGERGQHATWSRGATAGTGSGVDRAAMGGHGDSAERKPWSRHPARGGAWR